MDAKRFASPAFGEALKTIGPVGYIAYRPALVRRRLDLPDDTIVALSEWLAARASGVRGAGPGAGPGAGT